jgi:eukaryotic-like serine/threonine-protein kinase
MTAGRGAGPSPERWSLVSSLLDDLIELPASERRARLLEICPDDASLRGEVEALLAASDLAGGFLESPALGEIRDGTEEVEEAESISHAALAPGASAGPYRVVRELGRGGMGVVFLAERPEEPEGSKVAVKILRRRLDTNTFRRRFLRERAILEVLEHPNIAALIDGGTISDGTPFLVMEHVDGIPITSWCDARAASIESRLHLFSRACEAVAYAHARDVVHRDLKPANILVTAEGTVKLLDFGVARLLADGGTDAHGILTQAGERLITPEYAAPEQFRGEEPTTAMDVYALGIVLHELLVGRRPYTLPPGGAETLERFVRTSSLPAPSAALTPSSSDQASDREERQETARRRSTTPSELRRILRDGLDSIVLRALSPRPERRYVSVPELIQDLRWWSER